MFLSQYRSWLSAQPPFLQNIARGSVGFAIWAIIIIASAALFISGKMTAQEQLTAPLWLRIVLWIIEASVLVFLAIFVFVIARALVAYFVGDGDERIGWKRFAVSAIILWLALRALHLVAFWAWTLTPLAAQQQGVAARYTDLCTVEVQDDANSGHSEEDWHAGAYICAPLKRELHNLYPGPAWLFGPPPANE